jgi:hypothetical protein
MVLMVMAVPVVSRDLVVRAVPAGTATSVPPERFRVRPVKTAVMPATVPPVVSVVMVESVVRQAVPPASRVRMLPAAMAVLAVRADWAVMAARVRPVLRAAPALSPAVTAVPAVRVPRVAAAVPAVRAVSR